MANSKKYKMKFFLDDGRTQFVEFEVPYGKDGKDGKDGKTPVKGVDYLTREDKDELIDEVISNLSTYNGEYHITPSVNEDITMETAKKIMKADVMVEKVPYAEVTNIANGKTVTIG
jgi:hypothetical protein